MEKSINITIAGVSKCGKSNLAYLISTRLTQLGLNVKFVQNVDYSNQDELSNMVEKNLVSFVNSMKDKTIVINEVTTPNNQNNG